MIRGDRLYDFIVLFAILMCGFLSGYGISLCWSRHDYTEPILENEIEEYKSGILFDDVKVLCVIATFPFNHKRKAIPIAETWGRKCNRILFVSNTTDDELPILTVEVLENRDKLWLKIRTAFEWIYRNTLDEYDWFLKADDDTYFHMDNLRTFLKNFSPKSPVSIGHKFKRIGPLNEYHSGGSGYVLSREAVRRLVSNGFSKDAYCNQKTDHEDLSMGRCLYSVGAKLIDSADSYGAFRFHPIAIWDMLHNNIPKWFLYKSMTKMKENFCCSPYFISMHYAEGELQYLMEYLLHTLRPYGVHYH